MARRILITGGAGFIGSHLAGACLNAEDEVHVVVRPGSDLNRLQALQGRLVIHAVDLRARSDLWRCCATVAPEIVYHMAASPRRVASPDLQDVRDYFCEDLGILIDLLQALASNSRPPARLVRAGTLGEYGAAPAPYLEDAREAPLTAYGAAMVAATHCVAALQGRLPFPIATARLALVYGPAQSEDYFIPWLIERLLDGERATVRRPADRRDLLHVDDAVAALMRMAERTLAPAAIVNVATGLAPTMGDVARAIARAAGVDGARIAFEDDGLPSGAPHLCGACDRAATELGWRAKIALEAGLARTVAWHAARRQGVVDLDNRQDARTRAWTAQAIARTA